VVGKICSRDQGPIQGSALRSRAGSRALRQAAERLRGEPGFGQARQHGPATTFDPSFGSGKAGGSKRSIAVIGLSPTGVVGRKKSHITPNSMHQPDTRGFSNLQTQYRPSVRRAFSSGDSGESRCSGWSNIPAAGGGRKNRRGRRWCFQNSQRGRGRRRKNRSQSPIMGQDGRRRRDQFKISTRSGRLAPHLVNSRAKGIWIPKI